MTTKTEIKIAKEIRKNLYLLLLGICLTGLLYGVLYLKNQPPVNKPISEETKNRIRQQMYKGGDIFVGDALSTYSKYDVGSSIDDILNDTINEYRHNRFIEDINNKTKTISPWIFIILIFGRYMLKGVNWVFKTSNQKE